MAIIVTCAGDCGKEIWASVNDSFAMCDDCKRKRGMLVHKKWEEMTLEEKVEDLNARVGRSSEPPWMDI